LRYDSAVLLYLFCTAVIAWIISARTKRIFSNELMHKPQYKIKLWMGASMVFLLMNLLSILMKQLDILMLSHYIGNTAAGIYSTAVRFSSLVSFGLIIVDYVFTPKISGLYAENNIREFQKFISQASRLIVLITIPVAIILIIGGRFLLTLYGKEFAVS